MTYLKVMEGRLALLQATYESLQSEKTLSDEKVQLLRAEIANTAAEMQVETQRRVMLEADIASHIERAKLLASATANAENEMRLHKIAANIWQGKIKVVRDETKV